MSVWFEGNSHNSVADSRGLGDYCDETMRIERGTLQEQEQISFANEKLCLNFYHESTVNVV